MALGQLEATRDRITAVVLAGGIGRRMSPDGLGINKAMVPFRGRPLISHVLERIAPQVATVVINADPLDPEWAKLGVPVVADRIPDRPGPLAGVHAALSTVKTSWLLSVPCDTPLLPPDLVERLAEVQSATQADRVSVRCGNQPHPVIALLHHSLADELAAYLAEGGRRIEGWLARGNWAEALFDDEQAFVNLNTVDELRLLERTK